VSRGKLFISTLIIYAFMPFSLHQSDFDINSSQRFTVMHLMENDLKYIQLWVEN